MRYIYYGLWHCWGPVTSSKMAAKIAPFLKKTRKAPGGIRPRRYSPSPQGAKYVTVTQDTSPRGKAEVCHEQLFG